MGKSRVEVAAAMWPYITVVTNMFGDAQVHARLYTAQALHGESLRFTTGAAARGAAICLRESPCRDIFVTDLVLVNKNVELAGLHVFRYSARPGTPATRMSGQVPEPAKKRRAAALLDDAAAARARWARRGLGTLTRVLAETRLDDGRWVGHAEDHVLVAVQPRSDDPTDLENAILTVRRTAIDGGHPERVLGEILHVDPAPHPLRASLPVLTA